MRVNFQTEHEPTGDWSADAINLGERFCVRRFLRRLDEFVDFAKRAALPVHLLTPYYVRERDLDTLIEKIAAVAEHFAGVYVGDVGLARRLADRNAVTYVGSVYNRDAAQLLHDEVGVRRLQMYPPRLASLAEVRAVLPVEIVVHGHIPISATPRCPVRSHLGNCDACEQVRQVSGGPAPLWQRGNTFYAGRKIITYGLVSSFVEMGLDSVVIETFALDEKQISEVSAIYHGEQPPPNDLVSGMFLDDAGAVLDSEPWFQRFRR